MSKNGIPKKSKTKGELIPVIIFEFNNAGNLWFTKDQYENIGGYRGTLKSMCISILDIIKVHKLLVNPQDMPTTEWEG